MAGATPRGAGTTTALLTCMLLLAGALEAGATLVGLAGAERASVAATGSMPTSLLGVTLATILASAGGRVARLAALFGASLALLLRVGLMLVLVLDGGAGAPQLLGACSGLVLGAGLVGVALALVQHHGDLAARPSPTPVPHPGATPRSPLSGPPARHPISPTTPTAAPTPAADQHRRPGPWTTATTPWPRANEDDPLGTLIRPPRR